MPSSSAGQEDRVPLEPLGPVVGQELDAGRGPAGLDRRPPLDLGEERRDVGGRLGPDQVLGQLEERDDRAVALAGRLAVGDRVATDPQLAFEDRSQASHQRLLARDPGRAHRPRASPGAPPVARRTARRGRGTGSRRPRARSRWRGAGRSCGPGSPSHHAACRPARAPGSRRSSRSARPRPWESRRSPERDPRAGSGRAVWAALASPLPVVHRSRHGRRRGPGWRARGPRASSGSSSRAGRPGRPGSASQSRSGSRSSRR